MLRSPLDELTFSPDPGTPKDVCTTESPCDIGEGPCAGKDTCQNGLRCGTENCALFAGNNNNEGGNNNGGGNENEGGNNAEGAGECVAWVWAWAWAWAVLPLKYGEMRGPMDYCKASFSC